jgi:hypothetical protein
MIAQYMTVNESIQLYIDVYEIIRSGTYWYMLYIQLQTGIYWYIQLIYCPD